MAKTCCLNCDATYFDQESKCPKCGTTNFFSDHVSDKVMAKAVDVLIGNIKKEAVAKEAALLSELENIKNPIPYAEEVKHG